MPLGRCDARRSEEMLDPKMENKLKAAFERFRENPRYRFFVKVRQRRAETIRKLLSNPENVSLQTFNEEVWRLESNTRLDGRTLRITSFDLDADEVLEVELALDDGQLELHGNLVWHAPAGIYDPKLKDDSKKQDNVHRALRILNDPDFALEDKAYELDDIRGFGLATTTGLVMLFHPEEFAIYNKQSIEALDYLGYNTSSLEAFEEDISSL